MNAVLHEWAKASARDIWAADSPSKFRNFVAPMVRLAGQLSGSSGVWPEARSAAVVTTLNVDPGGYCPTRARLKSSLMGRDTTARMLPLASTATSAAGL